LSLSGCGLMTRHYGASYDSAPSFDVDVSRIANAIPRNERHLRFCNPASYFVRGKVYHVLKSAKDYCERGVASWYGTRFYKGKTSSGEPYNMMAMTAAHRSLPIPSYVRVTNLKNNRQVIVKINDRGPFKPGRVIDLSYVAAKKLGITHAGTARVEVAAISPEGTTASGKSAYVPAKKLKKSLKSHRSKRSNHHKRKNIVRYHHKYS
jgi:rare lipoprotein A